MSLFRLPSVASVGPTPRRTAAVISLTVVLPLLPVTPTRGIRKRPRQWAASRPRASRVSTTRITGSGVATGRDTSAAAAPHSRARSTKS